MTKIWEGVCHLRTHITLKHCKIEDYFLYGEAVPTAFKLVAPSKTLVFYAKSPEEKQIWMKLIRDTILVQLELEKKRTGHREHAQLLM